MNDEILSISFDFTAAEEADDGSTTHYGGTWKMDGVEHRCWGDDRSDSFHDVVYDLVVEKCCAKWSDYTSLDADLCGILRTTKCVKSVTN